MPEFQILSDYRPRGDQPKAIDALSEGLQQKRRFQTLLGVTGSGKTFTMANVIARANKPVLVIAHNKTLAAQLYGEFKDLFPYNAVEYFVSYYDYYQPEAYLPASDTYIEKETLINEEIERMRHAATHSLRTRRDVIVVASVSCIYGLGPAPTYFRMAVTVTTGEQTTREDLLDRLVDAHYRRSDAELERGTFRVHGDVIEVFPAYEESRAVRIELFGDEIDRIIEIDPVRGADFGRVEKATIFPGSHYVTEAEQRRSALDSIAEELDQRLPELRAEGKIVEAERLERRTRHDMEMLEQFGFCPGIENYSRHLSGRAPGEPPACLLDYYGRDFLIFLDESHQTVPQIGAMYRGDQSRKKTLVEHGFRLPSALDNRPLKFREFEQQVPQAIFVSATPADYERRQSGGRVIEQINRPTGLVDPEIEVRPAEGRVDDLLEQIRLRTAAGERTLVTCLTKRMAEELTDYYLELGIRCRYLHSEIDTIQRSEIIRDLRLGRFDVLIGINLLREGLDIPEAALVAVLDADKESFLRSHVSLIQTLGRVARNIHGRGVLYADRTTEAMRLAIDETNRRRRVQQEYNRRHGITPEAVRANVRDLSAQRYDAAPYALPMSDELKGDMLPMETIRRQIVECSKRMHEAARAMQFEEAAVWRDRLLLLQDMEMGLKPPSRELLEEKGMKAPGGERVRG